MQISKHFQTSKHFRSFVDVDSPDWTRYEHESHALRASYLGELAAAARRGALRLVRISFVGRRAGRYEGDRSAVPPTNPGDPGNEPSSRWTDGNGAL